MNLTRAKSLALPRVTFPSRSRCRISEVHPEEGALHVQLRKAGCYEGKPEV